MKKFFGALFTLLGIAAVIGGFVGGGSIFLLGFQPGVTIGLLTFGGFFLLFVLLAVRGWLGRKKQSAANA